MTLSEAEVRQLLLGTAEQVDVAEPALMASCSTELILKLDAITLLPEKSQRLVATTALLEQVHLDNVNKHGE